jgi:hypothetical protein
MALAVLMRRSLNAGVRREQLEQSERPRGRRAAKQRDEIASFHSDTSRAGRAGAASASRATDLKDSTLTTARDCCAAETRSVRHQNSGRETRGRVLRLTLLAPDILEAILGDRQPAEMALAVLMRRFPVLRVCAEIGTSAPRLTAMTS